MPVRSLPEQELGAVPAAVLLADQVLGRHLDVVEEHLVDLASAVHGLDRAHGDALGLHVDEQEGDAELLLGAGIGAAEAEDPVGILRQRGPGLLAVDDVVVALAHRRALEAGEVGAGAGLREALAPPVIERRHARQEALLLLRRAEGDDHRPAHRHVEGQRLRHAVELQLLGVDVVLHRRPIRAAPLLGPMRHGQALGVQDLVRLHHLVFVEMAALHHLGANRGRNLLAEKRAHLLAELVLFRAEAKVHLSLPQTISNRPAAPWPPPMHMVMTAYLTPRRLPSIRAWPVMRAPLMP